MKLMKKLIPIGVIGSVAAAVTPFVSSCQAGSNSNDSRPGQDVIGIDVTDGDLGIFTESLSSDGAKHAYFKAVRENPEIIERDNQYGMSELYSMLEYLIATEISIIPEELAMLTISNASTYVRDVEVGNRGLMSYDVGKKLGLTGFVDLSLFSDIEGLNLEKIYLDVSAELVTKATNMPTTLKYYQVNDIWGYGIVEPDFLNAVGSKCSLEMQAKITGSIRDDQGTKLDIDLHTDLIKIDENGLELASLYEVLLGALGSMFLFGWGSFYMSLAEPKEEYDREVK